MENNKKKIILAITKSNFGGAQRYVFDLAKELKTNFDISVISGGSGLLDEKLKQENVRHLKLKIKNNLNPLTAIFEIIRMGKILKLENPDIVHLNSSKMGFVGSIAGRLYSPKSKIIFTNHGLLFNEPNRNFILKWLLKIPYKIIFKNTDKIIAVSKAVRTDCLKISPKIDGKIILIYNGIKPINFLDKNQSRLKLSSQINLKDFVIGTIAELHPVKGLEYLIQSIPEIKKQKPNIKLIIIGSGTLEKKLKSLTEKLDLEKTVIFSGFVENASTLLLAFDIFVISSISEALAYTAIESSSAGLPIIATRVGGIPEIIKDQETGILIEPKNSKQISEKILWLLNNQEQAQKIGEKAKENILEKFSFKKSLEKIKDLYKNNL